MKDETFPEVGERLVNGAKVVAIFEDKYGEKRVLQRTRSGLRVKQQRTTEAILMNQTIAPLLAARIKAERKARGWSLVELAERLGWVDGNPKERVWAIENATRRSGIRLGTVFLIAQVFGMPWRDLLPADDAVRAAIKARRAAGK